MSLTSPDQSKKTQLIECLIKSETLAKQLKKLGKLYSILAIVLSIFLLFLRAKTKKNQTFNEELILESKYSALLPYLVAQAKVESANFTSNLFLKHNNMFGMNCVSKRPNTQSGCTEKSFDGGMSKGIYKSPDASIKDQILWLDNSNFPKEVRSVEHFANEMKFRGYYGVSSSEYIKALKSWI